jgi:putative transposase
VAGLNNRAENSHLPTGKANGVLQRFKSAEHAKRLLGPFSAAGNHIRPRRDLIATSVY